MNSISNLSSPISEGYLSSRFFKKPIVAIVAIALTIIVAVGIYFLKRSGVSLVCKVGIRRRQPEQIQNPLNESSPPLQTSQTTRHSHISIGNHQERLASYRTPILQDGKYQAITLTSQEDGKTITVPGAVIDFAEQTNAHEIQQVAPDLWLINCLSIGYFIHGNGSEHRRCLSPTPLSSSIASRPIPLRQLLEQVQG